VRWAACFCGLWMAFPGVASARSLVIVAGVQGASTPAEVQVLEAIAVEQAELRPGLTQVEVWPDREPALRCGPDPKCLQRILDRSGADLALLIAADYRVAPALVGLTMIDLGRGELIGVTSVDLGPQAPRDALLAPLFALFGAAQLDPAAVVLAQVEPAEAEVILHPAPLRSDGRTHWLAPGRYTLTARQEGYVPSQSNFTVASEVRRTVGLRLVEEPTLATPLLLGVLALAVVGVGAVVVASVAGGSQSCLCVGGPDACGGGCDPR
jgi:hypothetical protein